MPVVGLVGGIAPESTVDYYRRLVARYRERHGNNAYPRVVINSISLTTLLQLVGANQLDALSDWLLAEVTRLARAGADFGVLASNTPHIVFDRLNARSPIPLISIVESAAAAALAQGFRTVGLFGTRFTMEGGFYSSAFARLGIRVVIPNDDERTYIHDKYMGELVQAQFLPETRSGFVSVIQSLHTREAVDAIVLAGTELPLLLRDTPDMPCLLLDTTAIHVESIVNRLIELEGAA
jgi:aspartate racemase